MALPFIFLEWLLVKNEIEATTIEHPPIFIIGHYRSGTTLMHKLLASDPGKAAIRNYDLLFPFHSNSVRKILQPVLQVVIDFFSFQQPGFNHIPYSLNDPNEDDIYFIHFFSPLSAYWGYLFPKKALELLHQQPIRHDYEKREQWKRGFLYLIKKLTRKNGGRQLVLKSPPHTARIDLLLELFPGSRFIFLTRNPVYTYYSMNNLWESTILRYYSLQKTDPYSLNTIIFSHYQYLMDHYLAHRTAIPEGQLLEIRYEDLKKNPLFILERIYEDLSIKNFENALPFFEARLEKESGYVKSSYVQDKSTEAMIEEHWKKYIEEWY